MSEIAKLNQQIDHLQQQGAECNCEEQKVFKSIAADVDSIQASLQSNQDITDTKKENVLRSLRDLLLGINSDSDVNDLSRK